jgi:hypothetical protein
MPEHADHVRHEAQHEASVTGNPFVEKNRLIMRLDMAARSDELKAKLQRRHAHGVRQERHGRRGGGGLALGRTGRRP